jgi:hypothetical protein
MARKPLIPRLPRDCHAIVTQLPAVFDIAQTPLDPRECHAGAFCKSGEQRFVLSWPAFAQIFEPAHKCACFNRRLRGAALNLPSLVLDEIRLFRAHCIFRAQIGLPGFVPDCGREANGVELIETNVEVMLLFMCGGVRQCCCMHDCRCLGEKSVSVVHAFPRLCTSSHSQPALERFSCSRQPLRLRRLRCTAPVKSRVQVFVIAR